MPRPATRAFCFFPGKTRLTETVFHGIKRNFDRIDSNDDELIKSLAEHAFEEERFSWDN